LRVQLKISRLRDVVNSIGVKIVVYGDSGAGKTSLIPTLPGKVLILSAESGLLSIQDYDADVIEVSSVDDVRDAYVFLKEGNHDYAWVALDSFSEICEVLLSEEKKKTKDPRQAYGAVIETGTALARAFRDLPLGVYFSAKAEKVKDDATGRVSASIAMPGAKLGAALPYLFDEVFYLFSATDKESGEVERWLQTTGDQRAVAKDRSGKLDQYEPADLSAIISKIRA
jgi:phage nucleotide-binding protein